MPRERGSRTWVPAAPPRVPAPPPQVRWQWVPRQPDSAEGGRGPSLARGVPAGGRERAGEEAARRDEKPEPVVEKPGCLPAGRARGLPDSPVPPPPATACVAREGRSVPR